MCDYCLIRNESGGVLTGLCAEDNEGSKVKCAKCSSKACVLLRFSFLEVGFGAKAENDEDIFKLGTNNRFVKK